MRELDHQGISAVQSLSIHAHHVKHAAHHVKHHASMVCLHELAFCCLASENRC